jgi:hypothetical protein
MIVFLQEDIENKNHFPPNHSSIMNTKKRVVFKPIRDIQAGEEIVLAKSSVAGLPERLRCQFRYFEKDQRADIFNTSM